MSITYLNSLGGGGVELPITTLFDFNFKDSLTDRIHGYVATLNNATRSASGVYIGGRNQYINLSAVPIMICNRKTIFEIKIGDCELQSTSENNRFLMWTGENGFIYRGAQSSWQVYAAGWKTGSGSTNPDVFKNKICKMVFTNCNQLQVYAGSDLVYSNNNISLSNTTNLLGFKLGAGENSCSNMYIESFKAYIEQV